MSPSTALSLELPDSALDVLAERVAALVLASLESKQTSPWFDVSGAAEYARMTNDAVRGAVKSKKLASHRTETGRVRIHRDDLDAFLSAY